jgi:hypothetical protein
MASGGQMDWKQMKARAEDNAAERIKRRSVQTYTSSESHVEQALYSNCAPVSFLPRSRTHTPPRRPPPPPTPNFFFRTADHV